VKVVVQGRAREREREREEAKPRNQRSHLGSASTSLWVARTVDRVLTPLVRAATKAKLHRKPSHRAPTRFVRNLVRPEPRAATLPSPTAQHCSTSAPSERSLRLVPAALPSPTARRRNRSHCEPTWFATTTRASDSAMISPNDLALSTDSAQPARIPG
jgi:hypothetical protein